MYNDEPISQLDFRYNLVRSLINTRKYGTQSIRGRSSTSFLSPTARLENIAHIIQKKSENWRRRCRLCRSTIDFMCNKCRVKLHLIENHD